jgi:hypothetical protein
VALAEAAVGRGGGPGVASGDRLDRDVELEQHGTQQVAIVVARPVIEHDLAFGDVGGGHPGIVGRAQDLRQQVGFGLGQGDERGGVDHDHTGSPSSAGRASTTSLPW